MTTREEIDLVKSKIEKAEKLGEEIQNLKSMKREYKDCALIINPDGTVWLTLDNNANLHRKGCGLYASVGKELRQSIDIDLQDKVDTMEKSLKDFVL